MAEEFNIQKAQITFLEKELEKKLLKGEISPYFAANMLLK